VLTYPCAQFLLRKSGALVDDHNTLHKMRKLLAETIDNMNCCLKYATSVSEAANLLIALMGGMSKTEIF
jgi:hypothetical protein